MKAQSFLSSAIGIGVLFAVALSAQAVTEVRYGLWAKPGEAQYIAAEKFKEVLEKMKGWFKGNF